MSDPEVASPPSESFERVNFLELRNSQLTEAIKRVESERHYMEGRSSGSSARSSGSRPSATGFATRRSSSGASATS
jgi:hypothetical protein